MYKGVSKLFFCNFTYKKIPVFENFCLLLKNKRLRQILVFTNEFALKNDIVSFNFFVFPIVIKLFYKNIEIFI